ncbi:DUF2516 family protein [Branchiibius hedensis]|uniref:DUF2516 family protein n=1 Tax=Branchiibius hedensis TaxID=672460 RepID=UPI000D6A92A6|nr:DUF2516 family protein [Branchiibius hedensis]
MSLDIVQGYVALILGVALLALQVFAFVEALRYRTDAYPAAGKLTKIAWSAITGVAVLIGLLSLNSPLNIFELLATAAAIVFLVDVRPALRQVLGKDNAKGGRGPYGGW